MVKATPARTANAAKPPPAIKALLVFSSLLFVETSIFGSKAQTLDFPSWSTDTPLSTKFLSNKAVLDVEIWLLTGAAKEKVGIDAALVSVCS